MTRFVKKFLNDFEVINKYYNYLVEQTKKKEFVGITNEWLIDNFYLLVEHKSNIIHDKKEISKRLKHIENIKLVAFQLYYWIAIFYLFDYFGVLLKYDRIKK